MELEDDEEELELEEAMLLELDDEGVPEEELDGSVGPTGSLAPQAARNPTPASAMLPERMRRKSRRSSRLDGLAVGGVFGFSIIDLNL